MCGVQAKRGLEEALTANPPSHIGKAYQHTVDVLNGTYVDEDQNDYDLVDFLQVKEKSCEPIYSFTERFEKQLLRAEYMGFGCNDVITRDLWMDFSRIFQGNFKKEQGPEPIKKL